MTNCYETNKNRSIFGETLSNFVCFFDDWTILKMPSEIKPPITTATQLLKCSPIRHNEGKKIYEILFEITYCQFTIKM